MFFDLIIHKLSDELLNYCPALIHEKGGYLCCLRIEEGDCLRLYDTDGGVAWTGPHSPEESMYAQ